MANFSVTEKPGFLELRFHSLESGNAFSLAVSKELAAIAVKNKKWTKPVVVFSDHPSLFCSGGNLSDYAKLKGKPAGLKINRDIEKNLKTFGEWNAVKLAVVEGDVFGGGAEWLAYFDFRWMTPYTRVAFWQRRIGLSPGWGGGRRWAAIVGEERTRQLLLESRLLGAGECFLLGVCDRVVTSWKVAGEVEKFAARYGSAEVGKISAWNVKSEAATFTALWHGPAHLTALENWSKKSK